MTNHTYASAMAEAIHEVGRIESAVKHGHDVAIITQEVLSQLAYLQQQEKNERAYREKMIKDASYTDGNTQTHHGWIPRA